MNEEPNTNWSCDEERGNLPVGTGQFEWLRPLRRSVVKLLGAGVMLGLPRWVWAKVQVLEYCGPAPRPPRPGHASAAEGLPPLPLPVVPQRRTEKKNPPRPPVIVTKIKTGNIKDWGTDLNDVNNLLIWMKEKLGINFTYEEKSLDQIPLEASDVPVLYQTGHHAFQFTDDERARLRQYLLRGGMMIFDACCGKKAFADSVRREINAILDPHVLKPISLDHPIFHCFYDNTGYVRFTPHTLSQHASLASPGPAQIEGVEIACRLAVVLSTHDLSCGWDMHTHTHADTSYIESEDALKIGANFMAYATATRDMGVTLAQSKAYADSDPTKADKFRVGQLVHEGDWNPDPVGLRNLLDTVARTTSLRISFETQTLQPHSNSLAFHPFVYLTGHDDFKWTATQVSAIRQYLHNGGFMLADACCGRQKFDLAFRREIAKVLRPPALGIPGISPGTSTTGTALGRLEPLPAKHPLYQIYHHVTEVRFSEAARFRFGHQLRDRPRLEAAAVNGRMAVLYSPIGLNVGWRLKSVPYAVNYDTESSLQLGINAVMYALCQ